MGTMAINVKYYPTCPNPSITIWSRRHYDMSCITLLFQDKTGGLYVRGTKGNNWIHITPIKGALVVNIGDSMHIMSNDRYKIIEQCASDLSTTRIYCTAILNSSLDSVTGPFP
uniref:Fe2OG dioxygenase domain-containing protein n=1 Tax=Solanum lycopersicum TaxID=4081 RepID=A0A3Q7IW83_SOLLC